MFDTHPFAVDQLNPEVPVGAGLTIQFLQQLDTIPV